MTTTAPNVVRDAECGRSSGMVAAEGQAEPGKEEKSDGEERRECYLVPLVNVVQLEERQHLRTSGSCL